MMTCVTHNDIVEEDETYMKNRLLYHKGCDGLVLNGDWRDHD